MESSTQANQTVTDIESTEKFLTGHGISFKVILKFEFIVVIHIRQYITKQHSQSRKD